MKEAKTFMYSKPGFRVIRADHIHPIVGHNTPSTDGGDIDKAKGILKKSPNATFRILNNGIYYDYTNRLESNKLRNYEEIRLFVANTIINSYVCQMYV